MKPYAILSDQHCHAWSAFAGHKVNGVNARLATILSEMERAAEELHSAGGDLMVFAGDLFHVRGSIDPEVFNPTFETISKILDTGIKIVAIPGNHDLKGRETNEVGNAIQTLESLDNFWVHTEPMRLCFDDTRLLVVPWISDPKALLEVLKKERQELLDHGYRLSQFDVIIHAPVNGVLNIPDHGLDAGELAKLGFMRVFAGHYHNHKHLGGGIYSIGATTHQTWSDIGTKAGFLLVYPDRVEYRASHAPSFVEVTPDTDEDEIDLIVDGNYVRLRGFELDDAEINEWNRSLTKAGAAGVSFQVQRKATGSLRTGATPKIGSIESSVAEFIDQMKDPEGAELQRIAAEILTEARVAE